VTPGGLAGAAVVVNSPESMTAERNGRNVFRIVLIETPVRCWASREIARAANTIVRWASMESRVRWKNGRASRYDSHRSWEEPLKWLITNQGVVGV